MNEAEILNSLIFYGVSASLLFFVGLTICVKKISYALISSIIAFFISSAIFFLLNADYNAVVQISVYCIAIPIIFAFSIMFTSKNEEKAVGMTFSPRFWVSIFSGILLALVIFYLTAIALKVSDSSNFLLIKSQVDINKYQMFSQIAKGFYIDYLFAFEFLALLLVIVVVGLSTIDFGKEKNDD